MDIVNASEITKDNTTYLLYAAPGVGKTSALKYLTGNVLLIDIDHTSHVLRGENHVDVFKFDTHNAWAKWQELVKDLSEMDLSKYDTIAFDNLSELTHSMLGSLGRDGKNNRVPEMRHYQQIDFFIIDSVRFLKGLGKRIVFFAWESTDEWQTQDGQIFNRAYPMMRDKIRPNLMGLSDVVARLTYNPETGNRGFHLQPSNSIFSKNQLDNRKHCLQSEIFNVGDVKNDD